MVHLESVLHPFRKFVRFVRHNPQQDCCGNSGIFVQQAVDVASGLRNATRRRDAGLRNATNRRYAATGGGAHGDDAGRFSALERALRAERLKMDAREALDPSRKMRLVKVSRVRLPKHVFCFFYRSFPFWGGFLGYDVDAIGVLFGVLLFSWGALGIFLGCSWDALCNVMVQSFWLNEVNSVRRHKTRASQSKCWPRIKGGLHSKRCTAVFCVLQAEG